MKLYRFKSNPATILQRINSTHVQIVWSKSFEHNKFDEFVYYANQEGNDNFIPLTDAECEEVVAKRMAKKLTNSIGIFV